MPRYKAYNYDQLVMLPISLENQLVPGTLEHTINKLVEKYIDLSVFEERYNNDDTGATAINPKVLLKIIWVCFI
jgi:transposase